ncbi:hypothetical protein RRG08_064253 [Elysia crispata]|uniref:Uncharacterized protein n=1 Tax=Elysia crispata TaxID=231223 RepID=A0AAE1AWQ3_9GAST|nr:hypothetical protein RRG08_064253 [Elysia crispata]
MAVILLPHQGCLLTQSPSVNYCSEFITVLGRCVCGGILTQTPSGNYCSIVSVVDNFCFSSTSRSWAWVSLPHHSSSRDAPVHRAEYNHYNNDERAVKLVQNLGSRRLSVKH